MSEDAMTEELKPLPCPWCGSKPHVFEITGDWYIQCTDMDCNADAMVSDKASEALAIKAWNTRSPAWRDDMEAAKEYQYSRHGRGDDRLGVIVVCQWGSRWSANHAWWNDHEEEWNDISGDQIVHPVYWAPLPPKLKVGGEHDNDK